MDIRPARLLWLLTALFALRVIGQALQHWSPVGWLPGFAEWQGSSLGYAPLLAIQLCIVAGMAIASHRAGNGTLRSTRSRMTAATWIGGVYMAGSISRVLVGLAFPESHAWFRAWISGAFHIVLAGFVLALARYHRSRVEPA